MQGERPRQATLSPQGVGREDILKPVASHRNRDIVIGRDMERRGQQFVAILQVDAESVAILELGLKASLREAGFELSRAVAFDVVEAGTPGELTYRFDGRSRAVLSRGKRPPKVVATEESDLRVEVVLDQ